MLIRGHVDVPMVKLLTILSRGTIIFVQDCFNILPFKLILFNFKAMSAVHWLIFSAFLVIITFVSFKFFQWPLWFFYVINRGVPTFYVQVKAKTVFCLLFKFKDPVRYLPYPNPNSNYIAFSQMQKENTMKKTRKHDFSALNISHWFGMCSVEWYNTVFPLVMECLCLINSVWSVVELKLNSAFKVWWILHPVNLNSFLVYAEQHYICWSVASIIDLCCF